MNLTVTRTLPEELIAEILLRLPVKSLVRFKCVCKSWFSLISDPQFAKSHFDLAAAPTHRLLVDKSFRASIDIEAFFDDDSALVHLATPIPFYRNSSLRMLGSCRGFILLKFGRNSNFDLILWNPSTGSHKTIPFSRPYSWSSSYCGLGYDVATDDYLVITILPHRIEFFSLKTNSWNKIEGNYPFSKDGDDWGWYAYKVGKVGLFLNGALHWLDVPDGVDVVDKTARCLSLCYCWSRGTSEAMIEIWTMKEYKVQSSWTKSAVSITFLMAPDIYLSPICFTEGGEIVVGSDDRGVLMKLNGEGKLLNYRKYNRGFVESMSLSNPFSIMYRESLLSLPSDIGEANKDDQ
ncbi:F-box protein CPR1-like [Gastrolobium bilobum]|uniref:F-box protein CPR1-like n=1 Tax=Gastrolobium bilobum TaxID=150636 RepID=UPI002AB0C2B1|nr:F-box protein CPR1-like [Gastrolobium bilobum]